MSLESFTKGIWHSIEKGAKSAWGYITGDKEHPNGGIYISGSTSTDMGFNLEDKNTALTMGEMAPGEYTEMYGNNTAYNENSNEKGWKDYAYDAATQLATGIATAYIENQYNKSLQRDQNKWNAEQAELNRQFNASEAEKARQYETNMANTAHQREIADLIAGGLNPVNTATGGGGAATPGGSAASGSAAGGTEPPYMNVGNTALSLAETMKTLSENKYISKEKKAQIANTVADTAQKEAGTGLTEAQTKETQANTELIKQQAKLIKTDNITREDMNRIDIALKSNQSAKEQQEAISKALQNAYNKATGTTPDQSTVERLASMAFTILIKRPEAGIENAIKDAIKQITKE